MSIEVAVVNGTTPTSTGTQSYEVSGFGTPQAAIIFVSESNTTNNPEVDVGFGIGLADGTRECFITNWANDNVGTTDTARHNNTTACAVLANSASTTHIVASFSAWSTNGITLNFTTVNTSAHYISVMLIKGCTNVRVDSAALSTTGTNTISTVGFKANFGLLLSTGNSGLTQTSNAICSFGAFHNSSTDTITQGVAEFYSVDAGGTDVSGVMTRNDAAIGQLFNGSQTWAGAIQNVSASGFDVNTGAGNPGGDYIFYLVADTGDTDGVKISIEDSPTATGTWSVTSPGFTSQGALMGLTTGSAVNTVNDADPVAFGVNMFDASNGACFACDVDDAAATTNTQSNYSSTNEIQLYNGSGGHTLLMEGAFSSFNASGYDFSFPTTVDGTARKWLSVAIKAPAAAITIPPYMMHYMRMSH